MHRDGGGPTIRMHQEDMGALCVSRCESESYQRLDHALGLGRVELLAPFPAQTLTFFTARSSGIFRSLPLASRLTSIACFTRLSSSFSVFAWVWQPGSSTTVAM